MSYPFHCKNCHAANFDGHFCKICGTAKSSSEPAFHRERTNFTRRAIRDRKEFDATYHPGRDSADLVHLVHGQRVGELKPFEHIIGFAEDPSEEQQLCYNCGWTSTNAIFSAYTSRLKIKNIRENCALWELGSNGPWMLRDESNDPNSGWAIDSKVQQFLRQQGAKVPLVEMHRYAGPNDKHSFTMMVRAKGTCLTQIEDTLTPDQKLDISLDLKEYIRDWRKITSPHMQKVDGSDLRDSMIGSCAGASSRCVKTGRNEEEWLENLTPALRKGFLDKSWNMHRGHRSQDLRDVWVANADKKVAELKASFPRGGPYVLTHGRLSSDYIFVSDDNEDKRFKVTAVTHWENAGFFPWWVEHFTSDPSSISGVSDQAPDMLIPGYNAKNLEKIGEDVSKLKEAWDDGGGHTNSHHTPEQANFWYAPPFCACKPYCQRFRDDELGVEDEHRDVFDVDSEDSGDDGDDEPDHERKFPKDEREFLRWFNEISNHKSDH